MKIKKVICVLIIISFVFSLAGCARDQKQESVRELPQTGQQEIKELPQAEKPVIYGLNKEESKSTSTKGFIEIYTYAYGKKQKSEDVFVQKKFIPWIKINEDLTFTFRVNMYEGMADLKGTIKNDEKKIHFIIDESTKRLFDSETKEFILEQISNTEWVYRGNKIGTIRDGNIYASGDLPREDEPIFAETNTPKTEEAVVNRNTNVNIDNITLSKETESLGSFLQFYNGFYYKVPVINISNRTIRVTLSSILQLFTRANQANQQMFFDTNIWNDNNNRNTALVFAKNYKEFLDKKHDVQSYKSSEIHDEGNFYWIAYERTGGNYERSLNTIVYKQIDNVIYEITLSTNPFSKYLPDEKWYFKLHQELLEYCRKEKVWYGNDTAFNINPVP